MFIDETSAYVGQSREYGWGSSHERVYDARPKGKKARVSLVAATSLNGAMAEQALVISDTVNKNAFLCFFETTLLPTLAKGSVIVMDNWPVHHGDEVIELVGRFGWELWYLPTYSPDLNPIEHLFAKIKAFIKSLRPDTTDKLIQAFCDAVKTVTPANVLNAFEHYGYQMGQRFVEVLYVNTPVIYVNISVQEQLFEATRVSGMGHGNPTIPFLPPSHQIANDVIGTAGIRLEDRAAERSL